LYRWFNPADFSLDSQEEVCMHFIRFSFFLVHNKFKDKDF
jgi:hypothetical protein